MIGRTLGPYRVLDKLGEGGMGEVYRATDTRLGREVAIKVLPPHAALRADRRRRFEQEARAVSRLNHPGIVTLYGIEPLEMPEGAHDVLVMELVAGESLDRRLTAGGLPIADVLAFGAQAATALAAAHDAGVVHRDLKPANLMVTPDGRLKILDFGLARLEPGPGDDSAPTETAAPATAEGAVLGTLGYLSPEQAAGRSADARADVFSLGVVLYAMLTGASPFKRDTPNGTLAAVLQDTPPAVSATRPDVPRALDRVIGRCLNRDPADRPSAHELASELEGLRAEQAGTMAPGAGRRRLAMGVAIGVVAMALVAGVFWFAGRDARWAREEGVPALEQLVADDRLFDAFLVARQIERRAPDEPGLARLWPTFTTRARIESDPPGAAIEAKDFERPDTDWVPLGTTPLDLRLATAPIRIRAELDGYEPIEVAPDPEGGTVDGQLLFELTLQPVGATPDGMVRVGGGQVAHRSLQSVEVEDFWIDRLEVTNAEYQRFVDEGGYERPELWRHPIEAGGRTMALEEAARTLFVDSTGRPGPSTWALGRHPDGAGDLPVGGVSWYEAAAFAEWSGSSLPTYHHWYRAASPQIFSQILQFSRLNANGPVAAGTLGGLGPWGTLDMAGNVKEWVWNPTGSFRYALGGAWLDPPYVFAEPEAFSPERRTPEMGFRRARYDNPPGAAALAPVQPAPLPFLNEPPVGDEVFEALTSVYAYDRSADLDARIDRVDESPPRWRVERVSIAAAYGAERLPLLLFIPREAVGPMSVVIYFPESTAELSRSADDLATRWFDFLAEAGRVVVVPIYFGTYDRRAAALRPLTPAGRRDAVIAWRKDLGRTIDYLQTRQDIDAGRIAFYGLSLGAVYGPVLVALEERISTAIFVGGGFTLFQPPPEARPLNFVPRVRVPTLMVAGRGDFIRPIQTHQQPLFDMLGTPDDRKRFAVLDGGHAPPRVTDLMRELLAWLDRWLGPA